MLKPMMPRSCADSLIMLASDSENEICGLIFNDWSFQQIPNVANNPQTSFFMDPVVYTEVFNKHKRDIIGVFHSHPGGTIEPSKHDLDGWNPRMPWRYYIIADNHIREWVRNGNDVAVRWHWPLG